MRCCRHLPWLAWSGSGGSSTVSHDGASLTPCWRSSVFKTNSHIVCATVSVMPVTRSITRGRAATTPPVVNNVKRAPKRQAESDPAVTKRIRSSSTTSKVKAKSETEGTGAVPRPLVKPSGEELAPLPAKLIFSLEEAKSHLIQADHRFGDVFARLPCKPFERLEGIHPFRSVFLVVTRRLAGPFIDNGLDSEPCALP